MTGYGKSIRQGYYYNISVEIRSLNCRSLDIVTKLHDSLLQYESEYTSLVKKKCERGKIYLNITLKETDRLINSTKINEDKLRVYLNQINIE